MVANYEMNYVDALVIQYSIFLIIDRQSSREDSEKLVAIGKDCSAFTISYDANNSRNLSMAIEPRLLRQILNGINELWFDVDAATHRHVNVNAKIPGTPYLLRNLGHLLLVMRENKKRIERILAENIAE